MSRAWAYRETTMTENTPTPATPPDSTVSTHTASDAAAQLERTVAALGERIDAANIARYSILDWLRIFAKAAVALIVVGVVVTIPLMLLMLAARMFMFRGVMRGWRY